MVVTGTESGLFAATVMTTGAAAFAAATLGFYAHDAVERLLKKPDLVNANVERQLSEIKQTMQQRREEETSAHNAMRMSLDQANTRLQYLDNALERVQQQSPPAQARNNSSRARADSENSYDADDLDFRRNPANNNWRDAPLNIPRGSALGEERAPSSFDPDTSFSPPLPPAAAPRPQQQHAAAPPATALLSPQQKPPGVNAANYDDDTGSSSEASSLNPESDSDYADARETPDVRAAQAKKMQ